MVTTEEIQKLSSFIEANTRASEKSGITYIDPRKFKSRILIKQNHVIFGRRGAGKSSLINTIKENEEKDYYYVYTNIEDYKDVSFPNILIHVLRDFSKQLAKQIKGDSGFFQFKKKWIGRKIRKQLKKSIDEFQKHLNNPDKYDEDIKTKKGFNSSSTAGVKVDPVSMEVKEGESLDIEIAKKIPKDKLETLKNSIPIFKEAIKQIEVFSSKPIFLIFDDFYFLPKKSQVLFVDFFHRLTKDTNLYLKIATIRHRTKLYSNLNGSHFGTELGHDIIEFDLDYNLDRFEELKKFMKSLIEECAKLCGINFNMDDLFSDGALIQLCMASGGVPRDFLTLFVKASNNYNSSMNRRISKRDITEAAIQSWANKQTNLKTDSAEEREILEEYLLYIKDKIISEKKTNMFLVANNDLDSYPQIRQAIKELVDFRMLHLVDPNTSASGSASGTRYTAYMVDIGLYPNAVQHGFNQLEPGITDDAGRKDEMRGAPKINLSDFSTYITQKIPDGRLEISEE